MNGYIAIWKDKQLEVRAETSRAAQIEAARLFRARKEWEVSVYLCERHDGSAVAQSTCL